MNDITKLNKTMLERYFRSLDFTDEFSKSETEAEFRRRYSDEIEVAATGIRIKFQTPMEAAKDRTWKWTMAETLALYDWHEQVQKNI